MKQFITALLVLSLCGCAYRLPSKTVRVSYFDADMQRGVFKEVWSFEGELRYSQDERYAGYVTVNKFIGNRKRTDRIEPIHSAFVDGKNYCVIFPYNGGSYFLDGYGAGSLGVFVVPSWLPNVEVIAGGLDD